ncbi:lytic transglycosylase domain-containing protein [Lysobacter sp. A289]
MSRPPCLEGRLKDGASRRARALLATLLAMSLAVPVSAGPSNPGTTAAAAGPAAAKSASSAAITPRSGLDIYQQFRAGLADPTCGTDVSARWSKHYAAAPKRLASPGDDTLLLFGYVLDAVRDADLPSEYALIPFVESGYRPEARSPQGPAGLWQMIKLTARSHDVSIRKGYDGRLSPVDSTRAAVRYLKTLHGMFAGDWRLAVMAYNAGEYRIFSALDKGGQVARDADPAALPGLPDITHAYVRKLHALACVLGDADDRDPWVKAMDRPVPHLKAMPVAKNVHAISDWAARNDQDPKRLARLNPVFRDGRISHAGDTPVRLLVLATSLN